MGVPDKTAYETLETIKKNEGLENLPIIIFTGKNLSKGEESRIKQYADSIVIKTAHSYQRILDEAGLFLHLVEEKENLLREQENLDPSQEKEYRISFNHINAKLQLLNERITSAKIIDQKKLPQDEIHFGAMVTFKNITNNATQTFQLVGVDEANISKGKISFTTPLAKALLHKKVGEKAILKLGEKENIFEILKIVY